MTQENYSAGSATILSSGDITIPSLNFYNRTFTGSFPKQSWQHCKDKGKFCEGKGFIS